MRTLVCSGDSPSAKATTRMRLKPITRASRGHVLSVYRFAKKTFRLALSRSFGTLVLVPIRDWEIIADKLSKAGWTWGCVATIDSNGRTIWIADAHRDNGKRFVVRAEEKLTASLKRSESNTKSPSRHFAASIRRAAGSPISSAGQRTRIPASFSWQMASPHRRSPRARAQAGGAARRGPPPAYGYGNASARRRLRPSPVTGPR
jgi:hypothetical protein